jgi:hypothetical protein
MLNQAETAVRFLNLFKVAAKLKEKRKSITIPFPVKYRK